MDREFFQCVCCLASQVKDFVWEVVRDTVLSAKTLLYRKDVCAQVLFVVSHNTSSIHATDAVFIAFVGWQNILPFPHCIAGSVQCRWAATKRGICYWQCLREHCRRLKVQMPIWEALQAVPHLFIASHPFRWFLLLALKPFPLPFPKAI